VISAVVVAGAGAIWNLRTDGGLIRILGGVTHTQAEAIAKRIVASNTLEKLSNSAQLLSDYYANTGQQMNAERHQTERDRWIHERPVLVAGPGCDLALGRSAAAWVILRTFLRRCSTRQKRFGRSAASACTAGWALSDSDRRCLQKR
jgi:hypothetical protein